MSGGNMTKTQLYERINELTITLQEMKNQHVNEINLCRKNFEKQKQEMKENHAIQISLYQKLIDKNEKEVENLMTIIENNKKEIERIDEMRRKYEFEYSERLEEKDRREKTYKQTIK
ncbi:34994_t:CDS:1 [Racocetra persica]|uniref:34994_t:CDS:1 n=1 Tax=Racocetra persica TaxID=160502 RepID=A0ACA9R7W3_9GLOM|nr:34994_t:CDS:1 [Racocetra persica]